MTKQEVRELLEKQLQLLSEQSQSAPVHELPALTQVMTGIAYQLEPTLQK